jgi:hypothetical protein
MMKPVAMTWDVIESGKVMIESKRLAYGSRNLSDAALDGLFGGVVAGVAMAVYLVIWGATAGLGPGTVLGMFDPSMRGVALTGTLTHLAVASVYGILFGVVWWTLGRGLRLSLPTWLAGAVYGLLLLSAAKVIVLPAAGSPLAEIPTLHFAIAHVIYGAVLGVVSERIGAGGQ